MHYKTNYQMNYSFFFGGGGQEWVHMRTSHAKLPKMDWDAVSILWQLAIAAKALLWLLILTLNPAGIAACSNFGPWPTNFLFS